MTPASHDSQEREPWRDLLELVRRGKVAAVRGRVGALFARALPQWPEPALGEPYGRRVLHQGELGEVLLAGWPRGGRSAPHDHGGASGLVVVLTGWFRERTYRFDGDALVVAGESELPPRGWTSAGPGVIHELYARTKGLTLHFYAPGIDAMRVYDVQQRTTFVVVGKGGAWLPRDRASVRESEVWPLREKLA
jgi:hypothetical protein